AMLRDSNLFALSTESTRFSTTDVAEACEGFSRPSGRSIYNRRKEYSQSINREMLQFQHRVEHLFTCELDGEQLRSVDDCLDRLRLLEASGRVWAQDVILEERDGAVRLADIETREVLESWSLSSIVDVKAVLDDGVYDSLLTFSTQERRPRAVRVFMFQSPSLRADYLKKDLERIINHRRSTGSRASAGSSVPADVLTHRAADQSSASDSASPPPRHTSDYVTVMTTPPQMEATTNEKTHDPPNKQALPLPKQYTERERNVDVLNHLIDNIEAFVERATLQGEIENPSSAELTHCLFDILRLVVSHCSKDLPPSVVAPLLEPETVMFLSEEASAEEDQLWQSLGDAWNIPSTKWPEDDEDIPTFTPVFDDGWVPLEITQTPPNSRGRAQEPPRGSEPRPKGTTREPEPEERNKTGQVGYVPNNMLQTPHPQQQEKPEAPAAPELSRTSRPEQVRVWLEHKGFNKITVRCLGGLSGSMLLGMTRDELKTVCPEEGGRVFHQLQNVKSALATAREVTPMI
ncbi:hypothetical protein DNTS_029350, partial [Danionella cerebrum]